MIDALTDGTIRILSLRTSVWTNAAFLSLVGQEEESQAVSDPYTLIIHFRGTLGRESPLLTNYCCQTLLVSRRMQISYIDKQATSY